MATILIVDDEKNIREGLKRALKPSGYNIILAGDGKKGYEIFSSQHIDLALLDIKMPGMSGMDLLKKMNEAENTPPVIFITGHGSVETAVEAMHLGAYDFMVKPLNLDKLEMIINRALNHKALENTNRSLVVQLKEFEINKLIIGRSPAIKELIEKIKLIAPSRGNVYISGESGTGKELVCDAIHHYSMEDKPLIKVNCAALAPTLMESELFGHEKGAFTGAVKQKTGRFEAANQGTIFLDEISEIPQNIQVKLLRVLQDKKIERVGSTRPLNVDIRIICASNKDLQDEIKKGNFREDLFYRLNVLDIHIPPLRERKMDIEILARYFLEQFTEENKKYNLNLTSAAYTALSSYDWPGNVRELRNVIEKLVIMNKKDKITVNDLPDHIRQVDISTKGIYIPYGISLDEADSRIIMETIRYCKGNKSDAAKVLGIGRKTLHRKLDEFKKG
ncbi:MAG TPA: sigma-54 dependent transcriptional regulator [Spirochaetota bacterium]|nr:sigma-54 dependent transcriptional regulator [Spirochaetota bacterium]